VLDATVQAALAAELAGFDDVWFAEHHFMSCGVCPSAATLAAYVLGQTERIAVGTAVSVLSTHPPRIPPHDGGRIGRTDHVGNGFAGSARAGPPGRGG
jgi:hypothetical protein